jgi:NAD(P)-dependent dehydrogenase (short-subunit alcohol dehydrogenase family)
VLGLFRSLRTTAFVKGVRVNLLCPYFVDTPLFTIAGRALIAGGAMGKAEDVVNAGTRFMADQRIVGRALIVGPKIRIGMDDEWKIVPQAVEGKEVALWEAYADDYEQCEIVTVKFVGLLKQIETIKGWSGWAYDMAGALTYLLKSMLRR